MKVLDEQNKDSEAIARADWYISHELEYAGIEIQTRDKAQGPVVTRLTGRLGLYIFTRHGLYWATSGGAIPLSIAEELYCSVHEPALRVNGLVDGPRPNKTVDHYHIDTIDALLYFAEKMRQHRVEAW